MKIGDLYATLSLKTTQFKQGLQKVSALLDTMAKKAQKSHDSSNKQLEKSLTKVQQHAQEVSKEVGKSVTQTSKKIDKLRDSAKRMTTDEFDKALEAWAGVAPGKATTKAATTTATTKAAAKSVAATSTAPTAVSTKSATQSQSSLFGAIQQRTAKLQALGDRLVKVSTVPLDVLAKVEKAATGAADAVGDATKEVQKDVEKTGKKVKDESGEARDKVKKDSKDTQDSVKRATWAVRGYIKDTSKIVTGILISQSFYKLLNSFEGLVSEAFGFRKELETAQVSFETLLGDAKEAQKFMLALQSVAIETPFQLTDLELGARRLMAFGFEAKQTLPVMRAIADMSAVTGSGSQALESVTRALGQILTKGRVMQQELNQLTEAGVPAVEILVEKLGLTSKQLENIGNAGIPAGRAIEAILQGITERFGGAAEAASNTMDGLQERIRESRALLATLVFERPLNKLKETLKGVADTLQNLVQITRESGTEGFFKAIVPEHMQTTIKMLIAAFKSFGESLARVWKIAGPAIKGAFQDVLLILGMVLPLLAKAAEVVTKFCVAALQTINPVKGLVAAIGSLAITAFTFVFIQKLTVALKGLFILKPLTKLVLLFADSIKVLGAAMAKNPWIALGTIIVAVVLGIALSVEKVNNALSRFMVLAAQALGFDIDSFTSGISNTVDFDQALEDYDSGLDGLADSLDGVGDSAEAAGNKLKDSFLASFDEVFQVPDEDQGSGSLEDLVQFPDFGDLGASLADLAALSASDAIINLRVSTTPSDEDEDEDDSGYKVPPVEPPIVPPAVSESWQTLIDIMVLVPVLAQKVRDALGALVPSGALEGLRDTLGSIGDWLKEQPRSISEWGQTLKTAAAEAATNAGTALQEVTGDVIGGISEWVAQGVRSISEWGLSVATAVSGLATGISTGFHDITEQIDRSISSWKTKTLEGALAIAANLASFPTRAASTISTGLATISQYVHLKLRAVESFVEEHKEEIKTVVAALLSALLIAVAIYFASVPGAIATGAVAVIAAITTLFADVKEAVAQETGETKEKVITKWTETKQEVLSKITALKDALASEWEEIKQKATEKVTDIKTDLTAKWESIKQDTVGKVSSLKDGVVLKWNETKQKIVETMTTISTSLKEKWQSTKTDTINKAREIKEGISTAWSNLPSTASDIWRRVKDNIRSHVNGIIDIFNNFIRYYNRLEFKVPTINLPGGLTTGGWTLGVPQLPTIPRLETGGVVYKNSIIEVAEKNKPEAIVPLSEDGVKPIARAVAAELRGEQSSGQPTMYVHTLIADDRGLRELERRMKVIRLREQKRVVGGDS